MSKVGASDERVELSAAALSSIAPGRSAVDGLEEACVALCAVRAVAEVASSMNGAAMPMPFSSWSMSS